jgi:hypothetical protein
VGHAHAAPPVPVARAATGVSIRRAGSARRNRIARETVKMTDRTDPTAPPPNAGGRPLRVRTLAGMAEVAAADWDACAGGADPFISHAYLDALEATGAVRRKTGFKPAHVVVEDLHGRILAAVPAYFKIHSEAEYGPDFGWHKHYDGGAKAYYPKLQVEVPFTPVTGPRFLVREGEDVRELRRVLLRRLTGMAATAKVSSMHINYMTADEWRFVGENGMLRDRAIQFHWVNRGYGSFDDFLGALKSRHRTTIRRERREALDDGQSIEVLESTNITRSHMEKIHEFYTRTNKRYGEEIHFSRDFFVRLGERIADRLVLIMVREGDRYIAGAIHGRGADRLYTRYWGAIRETKFLHFEVTYYRAIEYAITHGLAAIDGGAEGAHKIKRGYLPTDVFHAHWTRDPKFRKTAEAIVKYKNKQADTKKAEYDAGVPYLAKP